MDIKRLTDELIKATGEHRWVRLDDLDLLHVWVWLGMNFGGPPSQEWFDVQAQFQWNQSLREFRREADVQTDVVGSPQPPAILPGARVVLRVLQGCPTEALVAREIAERTSKDEAIETRSVQTYCRTLLELGLIDRPLGPKGGVRITPEGRRRVQAWSDTEECAIRR